MMSPFVFLALVAITQGVPLTSQLGGRIVNGEDAEVGEIPFQVSLQIYGYHFCGGSILNKDYVITAAHCVYGGEPRVLRVVAGTNDLEHPLSIHGIAEIIVHAEYNPPKSWTNDIALVKVKTPFSVSETISYVPLPEKNAKIAPGSMAVTSGWGTLRQGGSSPTKLQRTDVVITTGEYCNKVNGDAGYPVYETQICAYHPDRETGPCHGDSGGPLIVDGKLVGIASWVIKCASSKYPTVFTRVTEFTDWIEAHAV